MARDIYPTPHAIDAMKDRDVQWAEVVEVVNRPEVIYGPDPKGRKIYQKGKLGVVVSRQDDVVTVLLRQEGQWDNEDARGRER